MNGSIATYRVVDISACDLLARLVQSIKEKEKDRHVQFEAESLDQPSHPLIREQFKVLLKKLHLDHVPIMAEVIDQYNRPIFINLSKEDAVVEFEVIT